MPTTDTAPSETGALISEPKMRWVIVALAGVVAMWVANWVYGSSLDSTERGAFGDIFGAVNALFSGLAFVGVVYAILMQRYEVALAKEDAKETKKILDHQSQHLEMQNKFDRLKSFEDTFFRMLSVFMDVAGTITFVKRSSSQGEIIYKGQHAISEISEHIYRDSFYVNRERGKYESQLSEFAKEYFPGLSHYFRSIEALLVFLTVSSNVDREFYAEIIRGQLSDAEQKILFHACLSSGNERLKALVERYHLLTGINDADVIFPDLRERFRKSAFEFTSSHIDDILNIGWRGYNDRSQQNSEERP